MSLRKERNIRPFKPQIHQKRKRGQNGQNVRDKDRNRSSSRDRVNYRQNYVQNFRPNYRRQSQDRQDNRGGSIDAIIMEPEVIVEIEAEIE